MIHSVPTSQNHSRKILPKVLSQGFTLLELMIAILIVAVIAAVAMPAYLEYATKAKISEGMLVMDEIKLRITELVNTEGMVDPKLLVVKTEELGRYVAKAGINYAPADDNTMSAAIWVRYNQNVSPAYNRCLNLIPQLWNPNINALDDIVFVGADGNPVNLSDYLGNLVSIQWDCRNPLVHGMSPRFLPKICSSGNIAHTLCPQG